MKQYQSKNKSSFQLVLLILLLLGAIFLTTVDDFFIYVSSFIGLIVLANIATYNKIMLSIEGKKLIIKNYNIIGKQTKNQMIEFDEIQYAHFERERMDGDLPMVRGFWLEFLFPSEGNEFIITYNDGKRQVIKLNADESAMQEFILNLPNKVPNQ